MVTTETIARTLRTLAERTATARPPYAGVIDEAENAEDDLERAGSFVEADGLDRLTEAIDAARRDGYEQLEERGEQTRKRYRRLQNAVNN